MDDESNVLLKASSGVPAHYSRLALASFVCAVLSIAGLLLGQLLQGAVYLVLFFVPAIVTGHLARRAFRQSPGTFRNESMATFGLSVGYLGLFLNVFVLIALAFLARN